MKDSRLDCVAGLLLLLAGSAAGAVTAAEADCDRSCLYSHIDSYLTALAAHDISSLHLTPAARYTENGEELSIGREGLWQTVSGFSEYQARVADPLTGQTAVLGEIIEDGKAVGFATRLKIKDGAVSEVETVIGRSFAPQHPSMPARTRPGLNSIVPAAERISRAEMIATVTRNFDNLLQNSGDHFAADCQRIENRMPMSGNPELNYPITAIPGKPLPHFGSMGCQQQVEAHLFDTLDSVDRRLLVVDEEKQVVFGVFSLRFYGRTDCNDIPGYGRTCPARSNAPMSLLSAEMLGVRDAKVHEVEVIFTRMPYDAGQGWE